MKQASEGMEIKPRATVFTASRGRSLSSQTWERMLLFSCARCPWLYASDQGVSSRNCGLELEGEVELKELTANFCSLGLQFCNLKKDDFFQLALHSINSRAGLCHHSPLRYCLALFPSTQWWWSSQFWSACSCQQSVRVASRAQYSSIQLHRSQMSQQRKRMCVLFRVCFNLDASWEEGTAGALLRRKPNKVICFIDVGLFEK